MEIKTSTWYEVGVQYPQVTENGFTKKVMEKFVVEAVSFTDAEAMAIKYAIHPDMEVKAIKIAPYGEILFSNNVADDKLFRATIKTTYEDIDSGKEKYRTTRYLIHAMDIPTANKYVQEHIVNPSVEDCKSVSLQETSLTSVETK